MINQYVQKEIWLSLIGGKWNNNLSDNDGKKFGSWIFSKKNQSNIENFLEEKNLLTKTKKISQNITIEVLYPNNDEILYYKLNDKEIFGKVIDVVVKNNLAISFNFVVDDNENETIYNVNLQKVFWKIHDINEFHDFYRKD